MHVISEDESAIPWLSHDMPRIALPDDFVGSSTTDALEVFPISISPAQFAGRKTPAETQP